MLFKISVCPIHLFILQLSVILIGRFILSYILLNIFKDNLRILINRLFFIFCLCFSWRVGIFAGSREWLLKCWPGVIFSDIFLYSSELSNFGFPPLNLFCLFSSCWFPQNTTLITHFLVESFPVAFRINLRHIMWHLEFSPHNCIFYGLSLSPYTGHYSSWIDLCIPPFPPLTCLVVVYVWTLFKLFHIWVLFSICTNATGLPWLKSD